MELPLSSGKPFITSVDVRGGGPGTKIEMLNLENAIEADIVLSGGSAFG